MRALVPGGRRRRGHFADFFRAAPDEREARCAASRAGAWVEGRPNTPFDRALRERDRLQAEGQDSPCERGACFSRSCFCVATARSSDPLASNPGTRAAAASRLSRPLTFATNRVQSPPWVLVVPLTVTITHRLSETMPGAQNPARRPARSHAQARRHTPPASRRHSPLSQQKSPRRPRPKNQERSFLCSRAAYPARSALSRFCLVPHAYDS